MLASFEFKDLQQLRRLVLNHSDTSLAFLPLDPRRVLAMSGLNFLADNAGVAKLYIHNDGNIALWDFLKAIDVNNNRVITTDEVCNVTLKVCGYSWGSISAIAGRV